MMPHICYPPRTPGVFGSSDSETNFLTLSPSHCTGGDDDQDGDVDPNWTPTADVIGPFPVVALYPHPKKPDRFLLAAAGAASKFMFDCSFGQDDVLAVPGMSAAVTSAQHSCTGAHFLMGSGDGSVRVAVVGGFELPSEHSTVWESQVHSMHDRVTAVCMTFDGTHVVSAASDGSMFTHQVVAECLHPGQHQPGTGMERFCSMADVETEEGKDILDSNAYTVEAAKQRLAADELAAAAEAKKATVREAVAQYGTCTPPNFCSFAWTVLTSLGHHSDRNALQAEERL